MKIIDISTRPESWVAAVVVGEFMVSSSDRWVREALLPGKRTMIVPEKEININ
jgi:hypothetical protein